MLSKMTRIFIGKDIARNGSITNGQALPAALQHIVDGEILVVDKNKNVLAAGSTIADTDTIYIVEGLGDTVSVTPESGSAITIRKVNTSDPIEGKNIASYKGVTYSAKSEEVYTFNIHSITPTADTDYLLRFVYVDMHEHPGQYTATYRVTAASSGETGDTLATKLAAKVMAHSGRRVSASASTGVITLTGLPIPECTSSLSDIDKFKMVEFEAFLNYVDANGNWQEVVAGSKTSGSFGNGNWEQVRDAEKFELGYLGITNQTKFPVIKPDMRTVKNETYDTLVIEHYKSYVAPNNQGVEVASLRTILYLADGASQSDDILGVLNPWMASCPGSFSNVVLN